MAKQGASERQAPRGGVPVWLRGEKGGHSWGSWAPGGAEGVVGFTGDRGKGRQKLGAGPASEAEAHVGRWHCLGCPDGNPQGAPVAQQGPGPDVICGPLHAPCSSSLTRVVPDPGTLCPRPLGTEGMEAGSRRLHPTVLCTRSTGPPKAHPADFLFLSLAKIVSPSNLLGNEACRKAPN